MADCNFISAYDARVASGALVADTAQRAAALRLQELWLSVHGKALTPQPFWRFWRKRQALPHGLYLYGAVGRGKSMLMDLFFAQLPAALPKKRVHFHAFMLDVHRRIHAFRQTDSNEDLLPRVIDDIADALRVLCLDEFQVSDVTDAMILSRLFGGLIERGVVLVMTSNRPPHELYKNGLQREQFLKFVDVVRTRMEIVEILSPHDYRLKQLTALRSTYHTPLGLASEEFLHENWLRFTGDGRSYRLDIPSQGRVIRVDKHQSGVAWLTFDELCARPLGANDYIELAKLCHTVLLQNIPQMRLEDRNEAKRFVTLIDVLYEHKVKLIATAACEAEALYPAGDGSFEFQRTASRLREMQSAPYLALAHLG